LSELRLSAFLPFRLNRLAAEVSQDLALLYAVRFGIDIPHWRVLATLGAGPPITAQAVAASTRTHKSTVSRAVAALLRRGWIRRLPDDGDRRRALLALTERGRAVYEEIVPLVLAYETDLLGRLSAAERTALERGMAALERSLGLSEPDAVTGPHGPRPARRTSLAPVAR
jgi:DNA-binding MarR family transcriptional regulator